MGHILLWVESLVAAIFWFATCWVLAGNSRRKAAWMAVATVPPFAVGVLGIAVAAWLTWWANLSTGLFPAMVAWLVMWVVGCVVTPVKLNWWNAWFGTPKNSAAAMGLAMGFVAAVVLALITFLTLDGQMKSQMAVLRADATALATSVPLPPASPDENAAPAYERAFEALPPDSAFADAINEKFETWTGDAATVDPTDADLIAYLDATADARRLLHAAAEFPAYRAELGMVRPLSANIPRVMEFVRAGKMLLVDARRHLAVFTRESVPDSEAAEKAVRAALADVRTMYRMADHTAQSSTLIMVLVSSAIHTNATQALGELLAAVPPASVPDAELATMLPRTSYLHTWNRSLLMEQSFGLSAFASADSIDVSYIANFGESGGGAGIFGMIGTPIWRVFLMPADLRQYQEMMAINESAANAGYPLRRDDLAKAEAMEDRFSASASAISMSAIVFPAMANMHKRVAAADARHRLAELAIAVTRYRAANGRWPATLTEMVPAFVPAVPRDPFGGEALKLAAIDGQGILYSIGENFTDDGGNSAEIDSEPADITLALRGD